MNSLPLDLDADKVSAFQQRVAECSIRQGDYAYYYSQTEIDRALAFKFQEQANYCQLAFKLRQIMEGRSFFSDADRKALHHALRNDSGCPTIRRESDFHRAERLNCFDFARKVRDGSIRSFDGRRFSSFAHIGLSGSSVSAHLIFDALDSVAKRSVSCSDVVFIDTADPDCVAGKLRGIDCGQTLFILDCRGDSDVLREIDSIRSLVFAKMASDFAESDEIKLRRNFAVVSSVDAAHDISGYAASFFFDDSICERYSSLCVASLLLNVIVFGDDVVSRILDGAKSMDNDSLNGNILENPAMFAALYGFFENRKKEKNISLCVPFADELTLLPPLVQHIAMDGNCRNTDMRGEVVDLDSGQLCFGAEGGHARRSFFSALHRGTFLFSLEMIGFRTKRKALDEMVAESVALFFGNRKRKFYGGRCSTMMVFDSLSAFSLGEIISYYENKMAFQSFLYDVDCFADDEPLVSAEMIADGRNDIDGLSAGIIGCY